jgi:membrane-bound serine protease (ClpP class)
MLRLIRWLALALIITAPVLGGPCVVTIEVDSVVHPVTVEILGRAIEQAERERCSLLLMRLNTPGGFLEATRAATEKMLSSPVPIAAYVSPGGGRAASAGFFLLQAADIAAMAPGTHTGAAHPVLLAGTPDETLNRKISNDAAASLRTVTERRGRNPAVAEKAVLESKSFTDQEALKEKLIDLIAANDRELMQQLDGRTVRRFDGRTTTLLLKDAVLTPYELTTRERLQSALADPNLALAMTVLGALGLYLEFSSPGLILPGVAGAILLVLGLGALSVLPLSWAGVALLLLAVALFVLEAKFASHGILGTGATVAMVLGAMMLIDTPAPEMRIHLSTALGLAIPFALITGFLVTLVVKARLSQVATGSEALPGQPAVALTELAPEGQVLYRGEHWQARCRTHAPAGSKLRITALDGLTLEVEVQTKEGAHV